MHGIIFSELRNYTEATYGKGTWDVLLTRAGLGNKVYMPVREYPDAEIVALVVTASTMTGLSTTALLEDFGMFLAPTLMKTFGHLLQPQWKTIDVIEHTERTVHAVARVKNPGAKPPELRTQRRGKDEVMLVYTSPRKMCSLAIGIAKGLARHFGENIAATENSCMHKGAPSCEIIFRKVRNTPNRSRDLQLVNSRLR
jgi:Haem-NO-binding